MENQAKVGVGVMIFKDGKILLGKRKGGLGEGEYGFPGGHLEYMETFEACAKRETDEECGVEIDNIQFQLLGNVTKYAPKHYVHLTVKADWKNGEPQVCEPDRAEHWRWYSLSDLPQPLFEMAKISIESYQSGKNYFDNVA